MAPASVKEQLKREAGQLVTDASGRAISFPDEAREDELFTPRLAQAPREERGYCPGGSVSGGGVHSPPDMAREARRETKIQFYGHKEPAPGQDVGRSTTRPEAPARTMSALDYVHEGPREDRPSVADLPVEANRDLAVQDRSYTPANSPEGTWADERRESIQPGPAELHADDGASAPLPVGPSPSTRELQPHTEVPMTGDDTSILTEAERELILGGLKGQDPLVLEGLVLGSALTAVNARPSRTRRFGVGRVDISAFVLPKKHKLSPEQLARIKRAEFAAVLRAAAASSARRLVAARRGGDADAKSERDTEFAKRWSVLLGPVNK